MKNKLTIAVLLGLAAGLYPVNFTEAVQAVPEPGQDIKPVQEEQQAENAPRIENQLGEGKNAAESQKLHFTMKEIRVEQPEGAVFKQQKLDAIAKKTAGHDITVDDLDKMLADLGAYARRHGYPAAYAYVPEQKVKDGILIVNMALGRYDEILVENSAGPRAEKRARRLIAGLKSGDIVEEKGLETGIFNINEINGIKAHGTLVPGRTDGTSTLRITLEPGKKSSYTLYADNYGNRSSGRYRYGFQADFMGLWDSNSRLTVGGMISNDHLHNYNIGWETQVGHSGTKLGISQSRTDYELGSFFQAIGARGVANTTSLYGYTPIWKTVGSNLGVVYGFDYRRIKDEMRQAGITIKKHSVNVHAGLDGMWRSGKGTAVHGTLMGYFGHMSSDSLWGDAAGEAANTLGNFSKATLNLTAMQKLGHSTDLLWKFQSQLAGRNLDGSEQMYLGGAHGVRAYPSGAGGGDTGALTTFEVRYHTPVQGLTLSTYLDLGTVRVAKDGRSGSNTLKGWGLGVTYTHPDHYFARLDYARRIGYEADTGKDGEAKGRLWFMLGKSW